MAGRFHIPQTSLGFLEGIRLSRLSSCGWYAVLEVLQESRDFIGRIQVELQVDFRSLKAKSLVSSSETLNPERKSIAL